MGTKSIEQLSRSAVRRVGLALVSGLLAALAGACGGGDAPTIVRFAADPPAVEPGAQATLSWEVKDALAVAVTHLTTGNLLAQEAGDTGTAMTGFLSATTSFRLVATNDAGSAERTVEVAVIGPGGPEIDGFTATPETIDLGASAVLAWQTTDAVAVDITEPSGSVVSAGEPDGMISVNPSVTTTYTLIARAEDNSTSMATAIVTVNEGDPLPRVRTFVATPTSVDPGDSSTLSWQVVDAATVVVTEGGGAEVYRGADAAGMVVVTPATSATYTLVAANPSGMDMAQLTVTVNPPQGAQIGAFTATPPAITLGQTSTLAWTVTNADRVEIAAAGAVLVDSMNLAGTATVAPTATTEYMLTAFNGLGDGTAAVTVTVAP